MKGLNKHRFFIQVICIPVVWVMMILKILVAIPCWVVAKCNDIMESIE